MHHDPQASPLTDNDVRTLDAVRQALKRLTPAAQAALTKVLSHDYPETTLMSFTHGLHSTIELAYDPEEDEDEEDEDEE